MKAVLDRVRDLDLVLKGGSALAFTRSLNRHSTDLDFDATRAVELRDTISRAGRALGIDLGPVKRRNWPNRRRFTAPYRSPFDVEEMTIKVDVLFRPILRSKDIEVVDGIWTYKIAAIFDQKLAATKSRIEPRDLFDLAFVLDSYGDRLSDSQIRRAHAFAENTDALERRYKNQFALDEVLKDVSAVHEVVVRLRHATAAQRDRRWPRVQEQRIPIPTRVFGRVLVIQNRARLVSASESGQHVREAGDYRGYVHSLRGAIPRRARERDVDRDWSISR